MGILGFLLAGLVIGIIAQFLVKGPHDLGCTGTIVLGILGSVVGGSLWNIITGSGFRLESGGFLASIGGAVVILVLARLVRGST